MILPFRTSLHPVWVLLTINHRHVWDVVAVEAVQRRVDAKVMVAALVVVAIA